MNSDAATKMKLGEEMMLRGKEEALDPHGHALRTDWRVDQQPPRWLSRAVKRGFDIAGAYVFFTVFLPVYLAVALGVKLSSNGPVFFKQERVGRGGKTFTFYKFRSMHVDSDHVLTSFLDSDPEAKQRWDAFQKLERDPRVTTFGRFIRRTSLDELPQFWNVLIGDMSLVGPRPCIPSQMSLYGRDWKWYCAMRPGLTGLWQVSGRNLLTYEQRVALDKEYVREWSIVSDLRILLKTVSVVITGNGSQ